MAPGDCELGNSIQQSVSSRPVPSAQEIANKSEFMIYLIEILCHENLESIKQGALIQVWICGIK
jgi:hypothetical protein